MSSLLDKSLDQIARQNSARDGGNKRSSLGGRGSPYARPAASGAEDSWKHDRYDGPGASQDRSGNGNVGEGEDGMKPSRVLAVQNLHYEVSERELEALFGQIGQMEVAPTIKVGFLLPPPFSVVRTCTSLFAVGGMLHAPTSRVLPLFDRSGRSEGTATVKYVNVKDAVAAKNAYDGKLAKGEHIKVTYDQRFVNMPVIENDSLLKRVQGAMPKLAERNNPRPSSPSNSTGPHRTSLSDLPFHPKNLNRRGGAASAPSRGFGGGRGDGGRGRGDGRDGGRGRGRGREGRPAMGAAKTADDLDRELEEFMNAPAPDGQASGAVDQPMAAPTATMDVTPADGGVGNGNAQKRDLDAPEQKDVEMNY
ncbi:hypothetical protein BT69DRAFT_1303977 [Atractiella rhizophila]|nr:hypothetical protein BT69DRAFT_1303977 [Atractiella rhizophila]